MRSFHHTHTVAVIDRPIQQGGTAGRNVSVRVGSELSECVGRDMQVSQLSEPSRDEMENLQDNIGMLDQLEVLLLHLPLLHPLCCIHFAAFASVAFASVAFASVAFASVAFASVVGLRD